MNLFWPGGLAGRFRIIQKRFNTMKTSTISILMLLTCISVHAQLPDKSNYLADLRADLRKEWPGNRTINLVFHGHSVPAGYFKTPDVRTLEAYPFLILEQLKSVYPCAVINVINTSIGGESSVSGAERFERDVLTHHPDVVCIDYALNDRGPGLMKAGEAWEKMIRMAGERGIPVILLTPSPDLGVDITEPGNILEQHANQIRELAVQYRTGLADSYAVFHELAVSGVDLSEYMSQSNHPNKKGHLLIAGGVMGYF